MTDPIEFKARRGAERRRFPRRAVLWCGTLVADARPIDCVILDMSAGGVRLQLSASLDTEEDRVIVRIPRFGDFHGVIAWRDEARIGVQLREDPARIDELMQAALHLKSGIG